MASRSPGSVPPPPVHRSQYVPRSAAAVSLRAEPAWTQHMATFPRCARLWGGAARWVFSHASLPTVDSGTSKFCRRPKRIFTPGFTRARNHPIACSSPKRCRASLMSLVSSVVSVVRRKTTSFQIGRKVSLSCGCRHRCVNMNFKIIQTSTWWF